MFDFAYLVAMASMLVGVFFYEIFSGFPLLRIILFWLFYILGYVVVAVDAWRYDKLKRLKQCS